MVAATASMVFLRFLPRTSVQVLRCCNSGAALIPHFHRAGELLGQVIGQSMAQFAAWAGRAVHIQGIAHHDQLGLLLSHLPCNFLYYRFPVTAVEYPYGAGQQLAAVADGKPGPGIAVIHCHDLHCILPSCMLVSHAEYTFYHTGYGWFFQAAAHPEALYLPPRARTRRPAMIFMSDATQIMPNAIAPASVSTRWAYWPNASYCPRTRKLII